MSCQLPIGFILEVMHFFSQNVIGVISLSLRLSLAQENSGAVPLGELIGCTKLT